MIVINLYFLMVIFTMCVFFGMSNLETLPWKDTFLMVMLSFFWPASLGFLVGIIIREIDKNHLQSKKQGGE